MKYRAKSRERLLVKTRSLLASRSIDDVGLRDIARSAEVNPSSVFYHFGSKNGLILTMVDRFISEKILPIISEHKSLMRSGATGSFVISRLLDDLVTLYQENKEIVFIIMNVNESSDELLRETVSRPLLVLFEELVTFLSELQVKKILSPERIPQIEAYLILSPLLLVVRNERYQRSYFPVSVSDPVFVRDLCGEIVRKTFS